MSEYNIQMNKYNALNAGYDQLYPQPMKHANTHAKDGSDPITPSSIGAAELGADGKVPTTQLPEISSVKTFTATIGTTWTENEDTGVKSQNVAIYATSNRRHIIKEKFSDREGDDIHRNDTMQELASLSERFGIHVTFSKPNKDTFLHIVRHLAEENGIDMPTQELELLAERFALERGNRSARLARQFIDGLLSKAE